jgi:hypothetical protein
MNIFESKKLRIAAHIAFWTFIWSFMLLTTNTPTYTFVHNVFDISIDTVLLMIPFYFNIYFLIPRYFRKENKFLYFFNLLLLVPIGALFYFFTVRFTYHIIYNEPLIPTARLVLNQNINISLWNVVLALCVSSFFKLAYDYLYFNKYVKKVENEKLKFEISFLKSQINPHFLFNIINSIYFQIDKNNLIARDSLEKLSNLLRYTLYESDKETVDIEKEISFIKTYFELQKIRLEDHNNINLNIDIKNNFKIKPLLILPLIENAFKHFSKLENGFIQVIIKDINLKKLSIEVKNSFANNEVLNEHKGVGIQNLKQRLSIFYRNDFDLIIDKKEKELIYSATLIIPYDY